MIWLAQELLDIHRQQGTNVAVENRSATNDNGLRRLLALDRAADIDPAQDGQVEVE